MGCQCLPRRKRGPTPCRICPQGVTRSRLVPRKRPQFSIAVPLKTKEAIKHQGLGDDELDSQSIVTVSCHSVTQALLSPGPPGPAAPQQAVLFSHTQTTRGSPKLNLERLLGQNLNFYQVNVSPSL